MAEELKCGIESPNGSPFGDYAMTEPQVINTLRTKAAELESHIAKLERALAQAKTDLAHINAPSSHRLHHFKNGSFRSLTA